METTEVCRISSKLTTIKATERGQYHHLSFFNVNCEPIWHIILVSPLLNLNKSVLDGTFEEVSKNLNPGKIWKSHVLDHSKGFHQHPNFSKETIGFYPN